MSAGLHRVTCSDNQRTNADQLYLDKFDDVFQMRGNGSLTLEISKEHISSSNVTNQAAIMHISWLTMS